MRACEYGTGDQMAVRLLMMTVLMVLRVLIMMVLTKTVTVMVIRGAVVGSSV